MTIATGPTDRALLDWVQHHGAREAAAILRGEDDATVARVLSLANPAQAVEVLYELPASRRPAIAAATPFGQGQQWLIAHDYPENTVGRLMERPLAVFRPTTRVVDAVRRAARNRQEGAGDLRFRHRRHRRVGRSLRIP